MAGRGLLGPLRTVVHEPMFDQQAASLFGSALRVDDVIAGIEWTLAREKSFTAYVLVGKINGTDLRMLVSVAFAEVPALGVIFSVPDLHNIVLHAVQAFPSNGPPAPRRRRR